MKKDKFSIILVIVAILFLMALLIFVQWISADNQKFYKLDFAIVLQKNGDVQVTENWDIRLRNTKTLYKNFEIDEELYSQISNVSVAEIGDNGKKEYQQIKDYQYHLDNHTFYALELFFNGSVQEAHAYGVKQHMFEIAWGVPDSTSMKRKRYEISYTIKDAVTNYRDCAEFYWQFLGEDFGISADRIKGTIMLPEGIETKEDVRAWGHLPSLSGNIKIKDTNTVSFDVKNYVKNQPLEVRLMLPAGIVKTVASKTKLDEKREAILKEEGAYAKEANQRRVENKVISAVIAVILFAIVYFEVKTVKKYSKMAKEYRNKKLKPKIDYEYFRELPAENTSPGQAAFLVNSEHEPTHGGFSNIFIATILSLTDKEYFEMKVKPLENEKQATYFTLTKKAKKYKQEWKYGIENAEDLQEDEVQILEFLLKVAEDGDILDVRKLSQQIEKNMADFLELEQVVYDKIEVAQSVRGNINFEGRKMAKKYQEERAFHLGLLGLIFVILQYSARMIPITVFYVFIGLMAIPGVNILLLGRVRKSISYLSQKGVDERDKWDALKNYMEDYSLLDEKTEMALGVWEKFLIYATAFGISEKVLEHLKIQFKQETNGYYDHFCHYDNLRIFQDSLSVRMQQILNSGASEFSSAGGFGGGFSSRRRTAAVEKAGGGGR